MKNKNSGHQPLSQTEIKLIEQLRQHPDMLARVQSILELAENAQGPLKTADEIEALLVQEMRQLGNTTMREWASHAEERVSNEVKNEDSTVRSRKKKR